MQKLKHLIRDILHYVLPKSAYGDYLHGLYSFVKVNEYWPQLNPPRRFMEHMLHMKRYGEIYDPLRQYTSDKYCLKQFVTWALGPGYTAKTYQVLYSREEVEKLELTTFPCVIKPTHGSGSVKIVRSKDEPIDRDVIVGWLKQDLYRQYREANYRFLRPGIIVEELIPDVGGGISKDYKIYCIDGEPKFVQVDKDRITNHTRNYYNLDWEHMEFTVEDCPIGTQEERPAALDEMVRVARTLAAHFRTYVRVDFFYNGQEIKVAELDHSSANCKMKPRPIAYDDLIGRLFTEPDLVIRPIEKYGMPEKCSAKRG